MILNRYERFMGLKELWVRFLQDMDNTMSIECSCLLICTGDLLRAFARIVTFCYFTRAMNLFQVGIQHRLRSDASRLDQGTEGNNYSFPYRGWSRKLLILLIDL